MYLSRTLFFFFFLSNMGVQWTATIGLKSAVIGWVGLSWETYPPSMALAKHVRKAPK